MAALVEQFNEIILENNYIKAFDNLSLSLSVLSILLETICFWQNIGQNVIKPWIVVEFQHFIWTFFSYKMLTWINPISPTESKGSIHHGKRLNGLQSMCESTEKVFFSKNEIELQVANVSYDGWHKCEILKHQKEEKIHRNMKRISKFVQHKRQVNGKWGLRRC